MKSKMKKRLYYDYRSNTQPRIFKENKYIRSVLREQNFVRKNKDLLKGLYGLTKIGLLKKKSISSCLIINKLQNRYIINDYHTKVTNNGYSRNYIGGGGFYCR